jgi:Cytochrome c
MKKLLRYFLFGFLTIFVLIVIGLSYVKIGLPNVGPAADVKIDYTPERIARGKYLAHSVSVCMDCHSKRDFTRFSGPLVTGTLGMGGEVFDQKVGLPGVFYAANITPAGISRYTDGELLRVITTGVTKEGKAMFPLMPYTYYGRMDTEDIYDIIAYIRSIPAIANEVPASSADFPMNFIINTIPQKASPQPRPDSSNILAYGAYLTNAAGCRECHSPASKGQIVKGREFSGGREFKFPDGALVASSNITPDNESGIGKWSKDAFVQRFKVYSGPDYTPPTMEKGDANTVMPWMMYSKMKSSDLEAIYTYLQSLNGIANKIAR